MADSYEVLVIGAGAAGLSAAIALGRSRRSVLVVDSGTPRNATAGHVHNFLTRDGVPPAQIYAAGREEVARYGGEVISAEVGDVTRDGDRFAVSLRSQRVRARHVVLATGVRDELPQIAGLEQRWGVDVLHCPYCHGWEVRDRRIGVLLTGPGSFHQALMFRQLSSRVVFLSHNGPELPEEQREQLAALGIDIIEGRVVEVTSATDALTGVRLEDGADLGLDALVIAPRFAARAEPLASLGIQPAPAVMGGEEIGTVVEVDAGGATSVPGVWAAGNVVDPRAQVVSSAASGLAVGAAVNAAMIAQRGTDALHARRHERVYGREAWDERYRAHAHAWSGEPNRVLVEEVAELRPGTALDAGAGEGGDAFWLAERGWQVTAVDLSQVALDRAASTSVQRGLDIRWQQRDLAAEPMPGTYDLVAAHYLHLPRGPREQLFRHLAGAVAPSGTLLIVGHDPNDDQVIPRPTLAEMSWTAQEVAEGLGKSWQIEVAAARPRRVKHPAGHQVTIHDAVLRARRR